MISLRTMQTAAWKFLTRRRRAYLLIPDDVIVDLAKFCRATQTTFHADPRVHAALEGRREVFLRIMQHRNMSTEELFRFLGGVEQQEIEQ